MLKMDSLKIERFRGILKGEIGPLADVNILVGRNNSGKSSIAEAIVRLCSAEERADGVGRDRPEMCLRGRNEPRVVPDTLWYRQEVATPFSIQAEFAGICAKLAASGVKGLGQVEWEGDKSVEEGARQFLRGVTLFTPPHGNDPSIEVALWPRMLGRRLDKTLVDALASIFGFKLEGIQLPPDGRAFLLFPDYGLPLDAQGDGTRSALRCLLVQSLLRDTMFVVEEPECHQHPGSLKKLALAMCRQAFAGHVQLLITTHSMECVRSFVEATETVGEGQDPKLKPQATVFQLSLDEGALTTRRVDASTLEALDASGTDVRFLELYA